MMSGIMHNMNRMASIGTRMIITSLSTWWIDISPILEAISRHMPYGGADKTVDVHLHWLRRKLGETADHPVYLHRIRGVGVKLVAPS